MDFSILRIPCGKGGYNASSDEDIIPIQDIITCQNVTNEDDTWKKVQGSQRFNSATAYADTLYIYGLFPGNPHLCLSVSAVGLGSWSRSGGSENGSLDIVGKNGVVFTAIANYLKVQSTPPVFVEGVIPVSGVNTKCLFIYNVPYSKISPTVIESPFIAYCPAVTGGFVTFTDQGSSSDPYSFLPTDWDYEGFGTFPKAACQHNSRMWGWGNENNAHTLYYSTVSSHCDFQSTGSGTQSVFSGEGNGIHAAISFLGKLFIWKKPFGLYYLDDALSHPSDWTIKKITDGISIASPNALCVANQNVFFLSSEGYIHQLRGATEYGDVRSSQVLPTKIGDLIKNEIALDKLYLAQAVYNPETQFAYFALPAIGSAVNNRLLILNMQDPKNPAYLWYDKDIPVSLTGTYDETGKFKIMYGNSTGFISYLDKSTIHTNNGVAYTSKFKTPNITIVSRGIKRVNLQGIEFVSGKAVLHNRFSAKIYRDNILSETLSLAFDISGTVLGTFTLGTHSLAGETVQTNMRRKISGDCRRVAVECYNENSGETMNISEILLYYSIGNDRMVV
jgi:hypothetical protein